MGAADTALVLLLTGVLLDIKAVEDVSIDHPELQSHRLEFDSPAIPGFLGRIVSLKDDLIKHDTGHSMCLCFHQLDSFLFQLRLELRVGP